MVPEYLAGSESRRGVRIPPHARHSARRAIGLDAAIIDQSPMTVDSLDGDGRSDVINVAGSAALLVAKLHKLGERATLPTVSTTRTHTTWRATMAGRAEEGVGQPDTVSASVSFLAQDLLSALA